MEFNISKHLKVLYVFVFGLYFGFFVLLYCNYAMWWNVEHFILKDYNVNSDDIRYTDISAAAESDFMKETKRFKRSHVYTRESRSSNLPTNAVSSKSVKQYLLDLCFLCIIPTFILNI